jgi:C2H2 type zinc finger protein
MAEEVEDTFDKLKAGAKAVAKKVTDPSKDLGDEYDKDRGKETSKDYQQSDESGGNDPMSPEKIASHEPTAVKRDLNQGTGGEPVSSQGTNNTNFQGKEMGKSSGKSDESTPGVSATFSCQECGKTFSSRQELKDHTQQQH